MKISNFTFIVTDSCNFRCSYCVQKKEQRTIHNNTIEKAVNFFYPYFKTDESVHVNFYGGEPLLAYEQVKLAVDRITEHNLTGKKDIRYALTTNGTLMSDDMLNFFNQNRFSLMLSFDGLAQDVGRKKDSLEKTGVIMKRIQEQPHIDFEINSVFTPQTIGLFADSIRYMIELGSPEITFSLASTARWNFSDLTSLRIQLEELSEFLQAYYLETGTIPVKNFQVPLPDSRSARVLSIAGSQSSDNQPFDKMNGCGAGRGHMAVTPDGHVWGCFIFHDFFKTRKDHHQYNDYSFGTLEEFIKNVETGFPNIASNYADLKQDYFRVKENFCFTCEDVESCMVCPVNAAYTSGEIGKISCDNCQLSKIERHARREFRKRLLANNENP